MKQKFLKQFELIIGTKNILNLIDYRKWKNKTYQNLEKIYLFISNNFEIFIIFNIIFII